MSASPIFAACSMRTARCFDLKSGMTTQPPPVASVEAVTGNIGDGEVVNVHKFKVWDKNSALENLAKRPRLFIERVEHSGSMSLNVLPEDVEVAHAGSSITEKQREANRILASPARNIMLRGGSRSRKDVRSLSGRAPASDKCSGFAACHSQISVQPREDVCLVRYAAQSSGPLLPVGSGEV